MNRIWSLLIGFFVYFSCTSFYETPVPLRVVYKQEKRVSGHNTLIVFLPGYLSKPEDFDRKNFNNSLKELHPQIDSISVDAQLGYYIKKILPERLLEDVIRPAYGEGYKKIWLVGISMGSSGALWYLTKYPETVRGVLLLAPFLGDTKIIKEIEASGGLREWDPKIPLDVDDYQRLQWLWLKQYLNPVKRLPLLALGFGDRDRFYTENMILAKHLPPKQVFIVKGEHEWETWLSVFKKFLTSGLLD